MKFIQSNWWKVCGVFIMIYVLTAGLLVPLKPGISEVSTNVLTTGTRTSLELTGYNTDFSIGRYKAFIRLNAQSSLQATDIQVIDDNRIKADFSVPSALPNAEKYSDATLILVRESQDYVIYPNLRIVHSDSHQETTSSWTLLPEMPKIAWHFAFPYRNILVETIRNVFFHAAIWMAMFTLMVMGVVNSILYLLKGQSRNDHLANAFTYVAILYGLVGVATGSIWARFTWGTFWTSDVKLNMTSIAILLYLAYGVLRASIDDHDRRARSSAIFNIFAFCALIPLIFVIPRLTSSLHPGNGGNPALGGEDLDSTLRAVFYPAVLGLILMGSWMATLSYRILRIEEKRINQLLD